MKSMGVATQADLDAVKKRVRDLERRAGMTASGRSVGQEVGREEDHGEEGRSEEGCDVETVGHRILGSPACLVGGSTWSSSAEGWRSSRAEAQAAVAAGLVTVAGSPATKPASLVAADAPVAVLGPTRRFVSRGGEKLRSAFDRFRRRPSWPGLPRRGRLDGRVHRLPAAGRARRG